MTFLKHSILVTMILLIVSCAEMYDDTPTALFGLPHVAIEMRESDFIDLLRNNIVNEYVAITIEMDGVKKTGKIRRRGESSRYLPKPSFQVITEEGEWHYVASNLDKSYCREVFSYLIFKRHGFLVPEVKFVALSVNNVYQGLYISREPINQTFFERRSTRINSLYRIRGNGFTLQNGHNSAMNFEKVYPQSSANYDDLNILLSALDEINREKIMSILNIENVAKYSFISSVINNADGITNNLHICNIGSRASDVKFEIVPYDLNSTFIGQMGGVASFPKFENGLLERAEDIYTIGSDRTREQYIRDIMEDIYRYGISGGILDSLKNEISQAYAKDPYHQGEDLDGHVSEVKRYITNFFP